MIILDAAPGSPEHMAARLGIPTASMASKLVTPKKLQRSAGASDAVNRWVAEWVTGGEDEEWRGTYWTDRGTALEPQARAFFELQTGHQVEDCAFIWRDEKRDCGCSPDGIVRGYGAAADKAGIVRGDIAGGLELKCPKLATHLKWLDQPDEVPSDHWLQVQFSLWVTRLPRWWFMSWAGWPNVPPLIVEVEPDDATQGALDDVMPEVLGAIARKREWLLSCGVEPQAPMLDTQHNPE